MPVLPPFCPAAARSLPQRIFNNTEVICPVACFAVVKAEAKHIRHGSILASQLQLLSRNILVQVYASQLAHLCVNCGLLAFIFSDAGFFVGISALVDLHDLSD